MTDDEETPTLYMKTSKVKYFRKLYKCLLRHNEQFCVTSHAAKASSKLLVQRKFAWSGLKKDCTNFLENCIKF